MVGLDRKHHSAHAYTTFSGVSVDPTGPVYNDHDLRTLLPVDTQRVITEWRHAHTYVHTYLHANYFGFFVMLGTFPNPK